MATRARSGVWLARGVHECTWSGLLSGDDGDWLDAAMLADKSVHVYGTFGVGGTVVIEGSNNKSTARTLTDPQGNALSFTQESIEQVLENTKWIRPRVTGGDGTTNLICKLLSQSAER